MKCFGRENRWPVAAAGFHFLAPVLPAGTISAGCIGGLLTGDAVITPGIVPVDGVPSPENARNLQVRQNPPEGRFDSG